MLELPVIVEGKLDTTWDREIRRDQRSRGRSMQPMKEKAPSPFEMKAAKVRGPDRSTMRLAASTCISNIVDEIEIHALRPRCIFITWRRSSSDLLFSIFVSNNCPIIIIIIIIINIIIIIIIIIIS